MLGMVSILQAPQLQCTTLPAALHNSSFNNCDLLNVAHLNRNSCRDKEHSTIIYESPQPDTPLLRLGWNKQDPRYMATLLMDSSKVVVLDIRSDLNHGSFQASAAFRTFT